MRPTTVAAGALQQYVGHPVENPCCIRCFARETGIDVAAPRPGGRERIQTRGVRVTQLEDPSARLPPISAVKRRRTLGLDAELACRSWLIVAWLADLVVADGGDRDRRRRLRARDIGARRRGFAAGSKERRGGDEDDP